LLQSPFVFEERCDGYRESAFAGRPPGSEAFNRTA
jgi:hypothetical protein